MRSCMSWHTIGTRPVPAGTSCYQLVPAGTQLVPAGPSWYQLVPAGTSWCQLVPTQLANHCIRANLGIRVSGRILVSGQTNWRKLPDRFGRPPPILSGYPGISRQPRRCNLSIPRYYRPPRIWYYVLPKDLPIKNLPRPRPAQGCTRLPCA